MKKQNKRKTKSFKSSILLLLLMAVLLISSTYAWFTANTTVTVSSIQVNVKATNGLQISTDGINFKSTIENADLLDNIATTYATNTNQVPAILAPVSTAGAVSTAGNLNMFYGEVKTSYNPYRLVSSAQTDTAGKTGNYIVFDLFLKSDAGGTIELTPNSKVVYVGTSVGLENAARVGFVNEGSAGSGDAAKTIQELNQGRASKIWEPNYDTHTAAAVNAASAVYGVTTTTTGGTQIPYYGLKAPCTEDNNVTVNQTTTANPNATYFDKVTPTYATKNGFTDNITFETLQKGITKYRVYMWIEGQDVDCENGASGSDIQFNLQFKLATT